MINSCDSVTLYSFDAMCEGSIGGIRRILIANRNDVEFSGGTSAETFNQLKISKKTGVTGALLYEWKFRRNTGAYTSTLEKDPAIGNSSVTTELTLQFSKAEAEKRMKIQAAVNAQSVVVVEDMYGKFLVLGYDNPVEITNAVMQSGTANTDLSGFTLTMNDVANEFPHFLDMTSAEIDALKS